MDGKQTPMKVKYRVEEKPISKMQEIQHYSGQCPTCNCPITTHYHSNYCGNCGQRLDWKDEDDCSAIKAEYLDNDTIGEKYKSCDGRLISHSPNKSICEESWNKLVAASVKEMAAVSFLNSKCNKNQTYYEFIKETEDHFELSPRQDLKEMNIIELKSYVDALDHHWEK